MATIVKRIGKNVQLSYRAPVRREGGPPLSGTFTKLSDARKPSPACFGLGCAPLGIESL